MGNFFLEYANLSFRDNLENILEIGKSLCQYYPTNSKANTAYFHKLYLLSKYSPNKIREFFKKKPIEDFWANRVMQMTFSAAHGYVDGYCEKKCIWRSSRRKKLGEDLFKGKRRLKCIECEQISFKIMLSEICDGKKLGQTDLNCFLARIQITTRFYASEQSLKTSTDVITRPYFIDKDLKDKFREFLASIVSYDFATFLMQGDRNRKRLKKCIHCGNFFISKTARKNKYCSDKCLRRSKYSPEEWRAYYKRYREKNRSKKEELNFEKDVREIISRSGYCREEAEEIVRADKEV